MKIGQHYPKADIDHLYVPRKQRQRGPIQQEGACILEIMKIIKYVESKEDPLI